MRILGIDPGSVVTGWGVVHHGEGSALHVAHGVLRPERGGAMPDRLAFLHAGLVEVIREHVPEIAVVERVFVAANPRSALVLGQARGVALAALGAAGIAVESAIVPPRGAAYAERGQKSTLYRPTAHLCGFCPRATVGSALVQLLVHGTRRWLTRG